MLRIAHFLTLIACGLCIVVFPGCGAKTQAPAPISEEQKARAAKIGKVLNDPTLSQKQKEEELKKLPAP
jgi:hypothetical protein